MTEGDKAIVRAATAEADPKAPRRKKAPSASKGTAPKGKRRKKKRKRKLRSPFLRLMRGLFLTLSILLAVALVATAYAGNISPLQHGGRWGLLSLAFPGVMGAAAVGLLLQVWWHWRGVCIVAAGFAATAMPCLQVCPLNIGGGTHPDQETPQFTLLTYNCHNFVEQKAEGNSTANGMVEYILAQDADIVCLQEAAALHVSERTGITAAQMARIHQKYPHIVMSGVAQALLSKFPVTPLHISLDRSDFEDADFAAYRVEFGQGFVGTLFNVHLQSLGLNQDDRSLYRDLTRLRQPDMDAVRTQLLHKVSLANVERGRQTQALLRFVRHYGGPNVLICGDFNDVPTCYAIRQLEDVGFGSAYARCGFGPMITYNAGRFYFCIDHILYRGAFRPLSIEKGTLKASDHYPLKAVMAIQQ